MLSRSSGACLSDLYGPMVLPKEKKTEHIDNEEDNDILCGVRCEL